MTFAVLRVGRLKGVGQVSAAFAHNLRTRSTPNADPAVDNEVLLAWDDPASPWFDRHSTAAPSPWDVVQSRITAADKARLDDGLKVRKRGADSVPGVEMILSASPAFFVDQRGQRDRAKVAAFRDASMKWLRERYGDRLIDVRLHLDEVTPHLQVVVVPITADNRLSAKEMFSGPAHMSRLQSDFAAAVAHLGIERGIEKSTATHTTLREYHGTLATPDPEPIDITVSVPPFMGSRERWATKESEKLTSAIAPAFEAATRPGKLARIAARQAEEAQNTSVALRHRARTLLDERQQLLKEKELDRRIDVEAAERSRDIARQGRQEAQEALEAERREWTARMRDIPLQDVLRAAGWDLDPGDKRQWLGPDQGRISLKEAKWFDHDTGKGGGKAIDLAKHLTGEDFEGAVAWLGAQFGAAPAQTAMRAKAEEPPPEQMPYVAPPHVPERADQVRDYLVNQRGFPEKVVADQMRVGRISANGFGNAVFRMSDRAGEHQVGAEKRGTGPEKFARLERGSDRNAGWFRVVRGLKEAPLSAVVVAESAIDALSARELVPVPPGERWMFASTAGARPDAPWLHRYVERGLRMLVGYDNDPTGNRLADAMLSAHPNATRLLPPMGKDWNNTLLARRDRPELGQAIEENLKAQIEEDEDGPARVVEHRG